MTPKSERAVLVTGSTGFIGRYLVKRLLRSSRPIVVLTRRVNGATAQQRIGSIFGAASDRLCVVEADLACPRQITETLAAHPVKIQTVIHCAGETSFASEDEERARDVQVNGPLALLETLGAQGLQDCSQVRC